jgi:hypothetical protein
MEFLSIAICPASNHQAFTTSPTSFSMPDTFLNLVTNKHPQGIKWDELQRLDKQK